MLSSRPLRWILAFVCSSLVVAGCATSTDTPQGETGSLSVDLVIADDIVINTVGWQITGNDMDMSGDIDVSAPGSTASVEVFGLPPGEEDYTVTLTAESADEEVTCRGSADFNVEIGETTPVMVILNCKLPRRLGGVRVNGEFNICAELVKAVVSPLETSVGNDISLSAQAVDQNGDPISYSWTGTGGSIANPDQAEATYTCQDVGAHFVRISVTDNDEYCDMANWEIQVTCVLDDAECQSDKDCESGEVCDAGQCVADVECEIDAGCDDENDCTDDVCTEGECSNDNSDIGTMCDQNGGSVCDGQGDCVECNTDIQCDVGEVCTANKCVADVECEIDAGCDDENDCTDDVCTEGECSNDNSDIDAMCDQSGGSVCDGQGNCVECNSDMQCDAGEVCTANECVSDGGIDPKLLCDTSNCQTNDALEAQCVAAVILCIEENPDVGEDDECVLLSLAICDNECALDGDCEDGLECTNNLCLAGACSFPPVMDDTMCDNDMGTCQMGVCTPNDLCEGKDCSDGNDCTADVCTDGTCSNPDLDADVMCSQNDGKVCDGAGTCVECNNNLQCDVELNETCVDNECVAGCTVPAPVDATGIPMACRNSFNQAVSTFPIDLTNVTPDDCIEEGQPFNMDIDPIIALDTAFLQAAAQTLCDLGTTLTEAEVTSAQVSIDAIAGATCTEQLSVLPDTPVTVSVATSCDGTCGNQGVECDVTEGIVLPLPAVNVPCSAAGTAGSEVQVCSTGEVPLAISLTDPAPPPAYQETYVGVSVGGGSITVAFACNTSSTTNPAPGSENAIGCVLANPLASTPNGMSCGDEVGMGDTGETPYPTSDCNTEDGPPIPNQMCDLFGNASPCSGTCETVPVAVDPSTVCATFTVEP